MALNLVKLCVGISSVEELQAHLDFRISEKRAIGQRHEPTHTTRMMPKRGDELLDGGSLYWVIKGKVQVRQMLVDIRPFTDAQGIKRCDLVMEPRLIMTEWQPRRAFQGWRYLKVEDAPRDLGNMTGGIHALPPELRSELANLGLI
ncbi:MAG: DUF1489 domain-containing protein [Rhizobiaceae bacterium]|nr:DUF1489 domain-containing protein [Rhizobiaceae bacterium]